MDIEKKIIYFYIVRKMSVRQIASKLKISNTKVSKVLHKHGAMRSNSEACLNRSTDDYRKKISISKIGSNQTTAKLNEEKVVMIRAEFKNLILKLRVTEAENILAGKYKVGRSTISDVDHERTWKHV